jgi:hypothetical protein
MVSAEAASNFSLIGCSFPQVNQTLYAMDKISGLSHGSWIHPLEEWPSKKKSGMKKQFTGHLPIDRGTWVTTIAKITRFWTKVYCHKKSICKIFNLSLSPFTLTLVFDRNNWVMTDLSQVIYILLHSVSMLLSCCSTLLRPLCKFVGCQSVYAYRNYSPVTCHMKIDMGTCVSWFSHPLHDDFNFSTHRYWLGYRGLVAEIRKLIERKASVKSLTRWSFWWHGETLEYSEGNRDPHPWMTISISWQLLMML